MIYFEFNLYDKIIDLLILNYNIDEISNILSLDKHFILDLLKNLKSLIISNYDESKFYIVNIIDKLNNKYKVRTSFQNTYENKIYEDIYLSDEEIMNKYNLNKEKYVSVLKSIYFELNTYNIENDSNKIEIIKNKIVNNDNCFKKSNTHKNIICNDNPLLINKNGKVIISDSPISKIDNINNYEKFIIISDTHFGSLFENFDYLKRVYEYASKNGIKNIIHTGDLIEGNYSNYERCKDNYKNIYSQVDNVLKNYCYDKNIVNHILLGNHDISSLIDENIDIYPLLIRDDFNILGYRNSYLKVNDDYITLKHQISRVINPKENNSTFLNLYGHSHQFRCSFNNNMIKIYIPTLSDLYSNKLYTINKGFIVGNLNIENNNISDISLEYVNFEDKNIKLEKHIK